MYAIVHLDTNDNGTYDFVTTEGGADGPYTADGEAVVDSASVTINATAEEEPATNETNT